MDNVSFIFDGNYCIRITMQIKALKKPVKGQEIVQKKTAQKLISGGLLFTDNYLLQAIALQQRGILYARYPYLHSADTCHLPKFFQVAPFHSIHHCAQLLYPYK
jgi:hypothetical protein